MQRARAFLLVCVGICLLALSFQTGALVAHAQSKMPLEVVRSSSTGRWAIVNPTPEFSSNIMLLDTATGETWNICSGKGGVTYWCYVLRTSAPTGPLGQTPNSEAPTPGR